MSAEPGRAVLHNSWQSGSRDKEKVMGAYRYTLSHVLVTNFHQLCPPPHVSTTFQNSTTSRGPSLQNMRPCKTFDIKITASVIAILICRQGEKGNPGVWNGILCRWHVNRYGVYIWLMWRLHVLIWYFNVPLKIYGFSFRFQKY